MDKYVVTYIAGISTSEKLLPINFGYRNGINKSNGKADTEFNRTKRNFYTLNNGIILISDMGYFTGGSKRYLSNVAIMVDIDGLRGFNTCSKDIFEFRFNQENNELKLGSDSYFLGKDKAGNIKTRKLNRRELLNECKNGYMSHCSALIPINGWKIPYDYPWL